MDDPHDRPGRLALRLQVAQRQVPEILLWAGVLTIGFGIVNVLTLPDEHMASWLTNLVFGPLFVALAMLIRAGRVPVTAVPWVWVSCSALLVGMLANSYRLDPEPPQLAYVAAVVVAFGPLSHGWPPFVAAGSAMMAATTAIFLVTPDADVVEDVLVVVVSLAVSATLLHLRIGALDALADTQAQLDRQATSDVLSGVLNRNGLLRAIPGLVAGAERSGVQVLVWFVDVRGLKAANDRFGHDLGDAIIVAVARALMASVRRSDLVARWGGDEFVVLGSGRVAASAEELNARVDAALARDPALVGRWSGTVTVGFASGAPQDVQATISRADADMYRRRRGGESAPLAG